MVNYNPVVLEPERFEAKYRCVCLQPLRAGIPRCVHYIKAIFSAFISIIYFITMFKIR